MGNSRIATARGAYDAGAPESADGTSRAAARARASDAPPRLARGAKPRLTATDAPNDRASGAKPRLASADAPPARERARAHAKTASPRRTTAKPSRATVAPDGASLAARIASLEVELAHEKRTSHALREVGLAIGSVVDLDQILELILSKIQEVLDAERATLFLMDHTRGELVSRLVVGESVQAIRVRVGSGIAGVVARTGKPLRVRDAYKDKRFLRDWDTLTGFRTTAILAAPMKNHVGRIIGVVQALNKRGGGEFTSEDESLLAALATQAAITVDNSRLYLSAVQKNAQLIETKEQLERRVRDLKLLFDLESAMGRAASLEELLRSALVEAANACDARAAAVLLGDDASGGPTTLYVLDLASPDTLRQHTAAARDGFIGSVADRGEASRTAPGDADEASEAKALGLRVTCAVGAPLEGQDEGALGAIALYNKQDAQAFSDEDASLLRLVAANVSTSVQLLRSRLAEVRAERMTTIGRLLSSVVHDLRTPMTVIGGYVRLMANADDSAERAAYAEPILRQLDLVQQMQKEVLEFARGQTSALIRRVYLEPFMRAFEQSLRPAVEGTNVRFSVEARDRGTARFDEGKVTRALHNLVRNAIDAMGEKNGDLVVRVFREADDVVFAVCDTGPGLPKVVQDRLFEAFVTGGKKGGTGLGLAIVKKIADEHAGRVEVQTSPEGTTFRLVLPQRTP